eukprot:2394504-Pyramimonas_sp.AAC.2
MPLMRPSPQCGEGGQGTWLGQGHKAHAFSQWKQRTRNGPDTLYRIWEWGTLTDNPSCRASSENPSSARRALCR